MELKKFDENGRLIVYSQDVYDEMWRKNKNLDVTVIDTFCINQKIRAKKDIKRGKLIYFRPNLFEFKQLSILLKKYGIETKEFYGIDLRRGSFEPYCYQNEMLEGIERKYGENFIDSLTEIAKKQYVIENPNIEYFENGKDLREKYLNKKNSH
jgi:cellobiose phosphorylase